MIKIKHILMAKGLEREREKKSRFQFDSYYSYFYFCSYHHSNKYIVEIFAFKRSELIK